MLDRIKLLNLTAFPQPEWNDAHSFAMAFHAILCANNAESSLDAYHRLLYAIGNDHAGTYYAVALGILPAIRQILQDGSPWSQHTALDVLIELCGSFRPEPGHELYLGSSLERLVKGEVAALAPLVITLEDQGGVPAKSARELLELIREFKH